MSCKDFWEKEMAGRLAGASRVAAGQVDGGQHCDRAGCTALVNLATSTCLRGHLQGAARPALVEQAVALTDALFCLLDEVRAADPAATARLADDNRLLYAQVAQVVAQDGNLDRAWELRVRDAQRGGLVRQEVLRNMDAAQAEAAASECRAQGYLALAQPLRELAAAQFPLTEWWDGRELTTPVQRLLSIITGLRAYDGQDREGDPRVRAAREFILTCGVEGEITPARRAVDMVRGQAEWLGVDMGKVGTVAVPLEQLTHYALLLWQECDTLERNFGRELTGEDRRTVGQARDTALHVLERHAHPQQAVAEFYGWGEQDARLLLEVGGAQAGALLGQASILAPRVAAGRQARTMLDALEAQYRDDQAGNSTERLGPPQVETLLDADRLRAVVGQTVDDTPANRFVVRTVDRLTDYRELRYEVGAQPNRVRHMVLQSLRLWDGVNSATQATPTRWLRAKARELGLPPVLAANTSRRGLVDWLKESATAAGREDMTTVLTQHLWTPRKAVVAEDRGGRERRFRAGDVVEVEGPAGPVRRVVASCLVQAQAASEGPQALLVMQPVESTMGRPDRFPAAAARYIGRPEEAVHEL